MHRKCVAYKIRRNSRAAAPCFDYPFLCLAFVFQPTLSLRDSLLQRKDLFLLNEPILMS